MLFQCFLVRVLQLVLWARSTLSSGCVQTLNCRQMRVGVVDTKRALINNTKIKSVGRSPRSHTRTCCPNTVCSRVVVRRGDMNTSTHQTLRTLHCRGLTSTPVTQESPVTVKSVSFTCLRDVLTVSKIRSFSEQYKNLRWDLPRRASPSWVHLVPFACLQGAGWPWPWRSSLVVSNLHMRPTILRNGKRAHSGTHQSWNFGRPIPNPKESRCLPSTFAIPLAALVHHNLSGIPSASFHTA